METRDTLRQTLLCPAASEYVVMSLVLQAADIESINDVLISSYIYMRDAEISKCTPCIEYLFGATLLAACKGHIQSTQSIQPVHR